MWHYSSYTVAMFTDIIMKGYGAFSNNWIERISVLWVSVSRERKHNKVQQGAHQLCFDSVPLTKNRPLVPSGSFSQIRSHIKSHNYDVCQVLCLLSILWSRYTDATINPHEACTSMSLLLEQWLIVTVQELVGTYFLTTNFRHEYAQPDKLNMNTMTHTHTHLHTNSHLTHSLHKCVCACICVYVY